MTAPPSLTRDVPLVGRVHERDQIVSGFVSGDVRCVLVTGVAGVGKTRLAAEVGRTMESKGYTVARVYATSAARSVPFGAFASLLASLDTESGGGLAGVLARAATAVLGLRATGRALVLVVDDIQLLDPASAALLEQLARSEDCCLVATARTPDSRTAAVSSPLPDLDADRINLDALDDREVEAFAAQLLGGPVAGGSVHWLCEVSAGNALFLRELLIGARRAGTLECALGVWFVRLPTPAPDRLAELVAARLAGLSAASADVIDLLAIGEPLDFALLEQIVGREPLEDVERQGVVVVHDVQGRLETRLSHPLYSEVCRQKMPRARLRRLSGQLAERLLDRGLTGRDDEVRIARLQLDAGLGGDAALFARAAAYARLMQDLDLATRLARASYAAGGGVAAGLALAEAQFFSGEHQKAEVTLSELALLCASDTEIAQVAHARCYNFGFLMGDRAAAEAVAEAALATLTDQQARLKLLGSVAFMRAYAGELGPALDAATILLDCGDDLLASRGAHMIALVSALAGRTAEAVRVAQLGMEIHLRCANATQLPESQLIGSILGHRAAGRVAQAEAEAERGYRAYPRAGQSEALATFALLRGMVLVEQGSLAEATRAFAEAATINREVSDPGPLRWSVGGLALAEGMSGNAAAAAAAVAELETLAPHWMSAFDSELIERGRAWAAVAGGNLVTARSILRTAADGAERQGHRVAEAQLLHDIARLGDPESVVARLAELADLVDGDLVRVLARHAAAAAGGGIDDFVDVANEFEALGALLLAAEVASEVAAAFRREGMTRQSTAWTIKVEELVRRCGPVSTPALLNTGGAVALTRREREIVTFVVAGLSSRDIADRLVVSSRTVENHLQHAYTKLGVTSREQLATAVARCP